MIMEKFRKNINWVPALYKIFDEIIVNAVDNHTRTRREKEKFPKKMIRVMSKLEVEINKEYWYYFCIK